MAMPNGPRYTLYFVSAPIAIAYLFNLDSFQIVATAKNISLILLTFIIQPLSLYHNNGLTHTNMKIQSWITFIGTYQNNEKNIVRFYEFGNAHTRTNFRLVFGGKDVNLFGKICLEL